MPNGINLPINDLMQVYNISRSVATTLKSMIVHSIKQALQQHNVAFDLLTIVEVEYIFFTVFAHVHEGCTGQHCKIVKCKTLQQAQKAFDDFNEQLIKNGSHNNGIQILNYHNKFQN